MAYYHIVIIGHLLIPYPNLVIKVTPFTVRHRKHLPCRIEYCETFLDVRFAQPFSVAGIVSTSPTTILPIGYVIGRLIYFAPVPYGVLPLHMSIPLSSVVETNSLN